MNAFHRAITSIESHGFIDGTERGELEELCTCNWCLLEISSINEEGSDNRA